jgi:hypothetical protein
VKRQRAKVSREKDKEVVIAAKPPRRPPSVSGPVASSARGSVSSVALLLGLALCLSLLVVAVAAVPPWMLPRQMVRPVYEHREGVMAGGVAIAISLVIGLVIALFGS